MRKSEEFRSRVYTERPDYADLPSDEKFMAILGIIATRLKQHPKAICSYSGGSDSDILIDLIERARHLLGAPQARYVFFNTGLELEATKRHVREIAEKYGVTIEEHRSKKNIVLATRECGQPLMSKLYSEAIENMQMKGVPLDIKEEFDAAENKKAKREELQERYPNARTAINFICNCDKYGNFYPNGQIAMAKSAYLYEFMRENPLTFKVSARCCQVCKKEVAHRIQKGYDLIITGEREAEGGLRTMTRGFKEDETACFFSTTNGQFRFRPLYYVSDKDKAWYKDRWNLTYSDAYDVYGLKRTGGCGCPISARAVEDLERIRPYEPNVVKAAWAIFGDSYRYRQEYNAFKERMKNTIDGQLTFDDIK